MTAQPATYATPVLNTGAQLQRAILCAHPDCAPGDTSARLVEVTIAQLARYRIAEHAATHQAVST